MACRVLPGQSCVSVYTQGQRAITYDAGKDLFQSVGGAGGLGLPPLETVFEFKQGLADRIGERDAGRVDKCDRTDTPRLIKLTG